MLPSCWLISGDDALTSFLKIILLFAKKKSVYGRAVWISKSAQYNEHWNKLSPWDERNRTPSSSHSAVNKTQESLTLMLPRAGHSLEEGRGMERFSVIQVPCHNHSLSSFLLLVFFNRQSGMCFHSALTYQPLSLPKMLFLWLIIWKQNTAIFISKSEWKYTENALLVK